MRSDSIISKFLIALLTVLLLSVTAGIITLSEARTVHAATIPSEKILPISTLESYPLSSPVNVYADNETTAIIQADNSLIVYQGDSFTNLSTLGKKFTSLKQVKKFSQNELIVSDNGSVYRINLTNFDVSLLQFGTELIGGTSFDYNGRYLVTSYGVKAFFYEVSNGTITSMPFAPLEGVTDTTIAVNDTSVFYVSGNKLFSRDFSEFDKVNEIYSVTPSKIVATNEYLFYILDGKIYRLGLDGKGTDLLVLPDSDYDLGKIQSATDLTIYNGNLLVTDEKNDCVQEFKIEGEKLVFTGFAIAKNKTAYNRIAKAKSVEKAGNTAAVLQDYKITLINSETVDYNQSSYKNLCVGSAPDMFAYSGKTIFGANTDGSAFILDTDTEEKISVALSTNVTDVCFKCGYYYAISSTTNSSTVYKIDQASGEILETRNYTQVFTMLEVDVFGNYYLATSSVIYRDEGTGYTPYSDSYGAEKMMTDLAGNLYFGNGKSIYKLVYENLTFGPKRCDLSINNIKDFCISIDEAEAFFIQSDAEYLYSTKELGNIAISSIKTPSDFSLSGENANVNSLKVYNIKESSNVYSVNLVDDGFKYINLASPQEDYLFIDEIEVSSGFTVFVLANHNGMAIANKVDGVEKTLTFSEAPTTVYTTTTVHAYYLPLITLEMEHALKNRDDKFLLAKHSEIKPKSTFTILDMEFYYAEITDGTETRTCYVPANFTVEVLAEDRPFEVFTIQKIKPTTVYSDSELTTEITELESTEVRVYETNGSTAKIKYYQDDTWKEGYIKSSAIINTSKNAVRNVLIILAVITSLCGTASFFILKKSKQ